MPKSFCNSLTSYSRFKTREVKIGPITIGSSHPICVQSMTTTDTMDTQATVEQSIRMIEAGCELVRITAPSKKEAENLAKIKKEIRAAGYNTPLVADIHFTPNAAEIAARIVEKVRVNPGNYADKKKFEQIDYTDESYRAELERIRQRFTPLVKICKQEGTAMRIGTNHGSLSDRIMSRYGDTPMGMVESALEFVQICEDEGYFDIVLSMKASNPQVMVQAYRLLVARMIENGQNYPLHLGVTEAGDGEDGRIKSAVGIGALLEDGLGDTVRVSLTEEPEAEIPVARQLVQRYSGRSKHHPIEAGQDLFNYYKPFEYEKRKSNTVINIGGSKPPVVVADFSQKQKVSPASFFAVGYNYSVPLDKWNIGDVACDYVYTGKNLVDFEIPGTLGIIYDYEVWKERERQARAYPLLTSEQYLKNRELNSEIKFISCSLSDLNSSFIEQIKNDNSVVLYLTTDNEHGMAEQRAVFLSLLKQGCSVPVVIKRSYSEINEEQTQLFAATDVGTLLLDGFGDGVSISAHNCSTDQKINQTAFGILQATRTRISKTEYISCPSCGRTLFDLQETTAKIREVTNHLKGVKIGIMGCIVNGPGEMADADFGYVGTGPGKITLYKEKEVVEKNIPEDQAVEALIALIKKHGAWIEPPQNA